MGEVWADYCEGLGMGENGYSVYTWQKLYNDGLAQDCSYSNNGLQQSRNKPSVCTFYFYFLYKQIHTLLR